MISPKVGIFQMLIFHLFHFFFFQIFTSIGMVLEKALAADYRVTFGVSYFFAAVHSMRLHAQSFTQAG